MSWEKAHRAQTLMQAHNALSALMPKPDVDPSTWAQYYRRSSKVYMRVAEIDRGHFHEATFWATREREKGEEIERELTPR